MELQRAAKPGFRIKLSSETVQMLQEAAVSPVLSAPVASPVSPVPAASPVSPVPVASPAPPAPAASHAPPAPAASPAPPIPQPAPVEDDSVNVLGLALPPDETPLSETNKKSADDTKTAEPEQESNSSWGDYAPHVTYEGETAIYTDPSTKEQYLWSADSAAWAPRTSEGPDAGRAYSYENDTHVYKEADGSEFFWDKERKAWIPKVDEDFLARYQMSYGFIDNTTKEEKAPPPPKKVSESGPPKRKLPEEPKWFDASDNGNTKVYVSNLPLDITEEEFVDMMQKCGLVMRDPHSQKMKVKLYYDKENSCFKGDALCTYIKIESVDLALKLLDGSEMRGNKISVQQAQFQLKGDYNPALKPKKKKKKELEKIKKMQQKLFDWRPEKVIGERSKNERVVIVKNVFDPSDFDKEVQLILDYQQDLREECNKCGEVKKIVLYDRHPEGVAQITMKEPEQADAVIQLVNDRWFGKRKLSAEIWDGRTKYRIAETEADINKRLGKWEQFLEGDTVKKDEKQDTSYASTDHQKTNEEPDQDMTDNIELKQDAQSETADSVGTVKDLQKSDDLSDHKMNETDYVTEDGKLGGNIKVVEQVGELETIKSVSEQEVSGVDQFKNEQKTGTVEVVEKMGE